MKGIILAGGNGTRLYPITKTISKQLLPIYNKPMIYYPLSVLINNGIEDILIITTKRDYNRFKTLLGDGKDYNIKIDYMIQDKPNGIAEAFILGKEFIGNDNVLLILGDNFFHGINFNNKLKRIINKNNFTGAEIFVKEVEDPERFGVVEISENGKIISLEEKPKTQKSNLAITGIYIFDNSVLNKVKNIKYSCRNELEIIDIINDYFSENKLKVNHLDSSDKWLDVGTHESLFEATNYVRDYKIKYNKDIGIK